MVPTPALADPRLLPADKIVLAALIAFRNHPSGRCYPSQASIAAASGYSRSTVKRSLTRLERAGWVTVESFIRPGGGKGTNDYRVPYLDALPRRDGAEAERTRAIAHPGEPSRRVTQDGLSDGSPRGAIGRFTQVDHEQKAVQNSPPENGEQTTAARSLARSRAMEAALDA